MKLDNLLHLEHLHAIQALVDIKRAILLHFGHNKRAFLNDLSFNRKGV
jgi:hypothetical protein